MIFVCLIAQFVMDRYVPFLYWFNVILMSICGTIWTDGFHDNLGIELWIECVVFLFLTCCSFYTWYRVDGTIDIHSINSLRREAFYWMSIFLTFALGTAIGDGISEGAAVGYGATFAIFVGAIIFLTILWYFKVTGPITSFWMIYVMTRPLGAALGDLLSSPMTGKLPALVTVTTGISSGYPTSFPTARPTMLSGGAGMGYGYTSVLFIGVIFILVTWMTISKFDIAPENKPQVDVVMESEGDSRMELIVAQSP